jgi:hypothetical protein
MVAGGAVPKNAMKAKMLKILLLLPLMNRQPKRGDRCR